MPVTTPIRAGWHPVSVRAIGSHRPHEWAWTREVPGGDLQVVFEPRYAQWRITHDDGVIVTSRYCPGRLSIEDAMSAADELVREDAQPVQLRKAS